MPDGEIKVKHPDIVRLEKEIQKLSPKEKAERAVASGALIHNLEMKGKMGIGLSQQERDIIARLNREVDYLMKDKQIRQIFEMECSYGGSAVIWTPG